MGSWPDTDIDLKPLQERFLVWSISGLLQATLCFLFSVRIDQYPERCKLTLPLFRDWFWCCI